MKSTALQLLAFGMCLSVPLSAHHELSAEFDQTKSVTLRGIVSEIEWNNPHVYIYIDSRDPGGRIETWAVELASPIELKASGWTRESVHVGDNVSVLGYAARDGSKLAEGRRVTLPGDKNLAVPTSEALAVPPRNSGPAKPTPRWPDGHPRLSAPPGESGYWAYPSEGSLVETTAGNIRMNANGLLANLSDAAKVAPFQPWAKGLYEYRQRTLLKDDPMVSCLPPGGPRMFQVAHGVKFLEQPDRQRIFVMSGGGNHNWRLINLDGRPVPNPEDESPTYFGYSSGKWDSDTLVVRSAGYAERFWFSNGGLPHSENLKMTERFSRPDSNTLKYEVTVDDAGAYTRPWTSTWSLHWVPNEDLAEYFCQDNPRDDTHMVSK
ncbi:MAG TPA: DUF6152 family protein [Bryobacteraceae bacterium]